MRLDDFAPNPRTANGFWGSAYLYAYIVLALTYCWTIRLPWTLREQRQWKRDKEINERWGRAVYAAQRAVEDEVYARTGSRTMNAEECERYNSAGKHLKREDFA